MTAMIAPRYVRGKLPAWLWRELNSATREAGDRTPVLVVNDGDRPLIVLDLDDYNVLASSATRPEPEAPDA
jgi:hypothetical protein